MNKVRFPRKFWQRSATTDNPLPEKNERTAIIKTLEPPLSSPILHAESDLRARYMAREPLFFMFISLFGMTEASIASRAELVDTGLRHEGLIPVYLVDSLDLLVMRKERRLFEHLPTQWQGMRHTSDLEWPLYLRRRYLLLHAKWQPLGRVDFGDLPSWLPDTQTEALGEIRTVASRLRNGAK